MYYNIILTLFVIVDMKTNIKMFDFKVVSCSWNTLAIQIHTLIETLLCLQIYALMKNCCTAQICMATAFESLLKTESFIWSSRMSWYLTSTAKQIAELEYT